MLRTCSYFKD